MTSVLIRDKRRHKGESHVKTEAELEVSSHTPCKPQELKKARREAPLKPQEKSETP